MDVRPRQLTDREKRLFQEYANEVPRPSRS